MTTNPGRAPAHNGIDPIVEALIKDLFESVSHFKAGPRTEEALTEALIASLISPKGSATQASPVEIAILAAALAPALAEALAPSLAEALTPAIINALNSLVSSKEGSQEAKEGS